MSIKNFRVAGFVLGLGIKAPVHTVSTVNLPTLNGLGQNIGGWLVGENDRVLLVAQTNPINNGIYSARTSAWVRDGDADGNRDFVGGTLVPVWNPGLSDIQLYRLEGNPDAKTIGVDSMVFSVYYDPSGPATDAPSDGMTYGRNNAAWVIVAGGGEDLQATTVLGNVTNQGLILHDNPQTQVLTILQTLNSATFTTTGAGIQFLGGTVEYFFDNDIRVANGNVTAQNNGRLQSLNDLATANMGIFHNNVRGIVESTLGPLDVRVDNGAAVQVRRIQCGDGAAGFVSLYAGAGDNPVFRANVQIASNIAAAEVKDSSDTYRQVGLSVMLRINVTGVATLGNNIWHKKIVSVGAATLTLDAGSLASIADDTVFWVIANVGAISVAGSGITVRKFLGGGAAVNGTATIAEGGWATFTKHSGTEVWVTGLDVT